MIKAKVIYIGPIRSLAGKREEEMILPEGATVKDLLHLLIQKYGEPFHESVLSKKGELQPMVRLLLKDGQEKAPGLHTKLSQRERITLLQLLQPFAGG